MGLSACWCSPDKSFCPAVCTGVAIPNLSRSVRPEEGSSAFEMAGAEGDEVAETASVAITDQELERSIDDEIVLAVDEEGKNNLECMNINDSEESIKPKMISAPSPPSRQEVLEHNITHLPFRCWCRHCVMGKAKADGHITTGSMAASEVPVVSFPYAFLGDRESPMTSGQDDVKKDEYEDDHADVKRVTQVLVGRDAKSRVCTAIPMPKKGVDQDEWAVREGLRFLELPGYTSVVLKTYQKSASASC